MKTEKEKMLSGELYKPFGEELFKERQRAGELIFDFNNLRPGEINMRIKIIRDLFNKTGRKFLIEPPFRCDYGYNIEIGENFYSNYNFTILDCAKVKICANSVIGSGSVVTKDIPDNVVAVGNPCRVLRLITNAEKTDKNNF